MNKFFTTKGNKQIPYSEESLDFQKYKKICLRIWGALPLDITWATGTKIYQQAENKLNEEDAKAKMYEH